MAATTPPTAALFELLPTGTDGVVGVRLAGNWRLQDRVPSAIEAHRAVAGQPGVRRLVFDTSALGAWDTGLLTFLTRLRELCRADQIVVDPGALPEGVQRLLTLASGTAERQGARRGDAAAEPFLTRVGKETQGLIRGAGEVLAFLGEVTLAFGRLLRGRARFRRSDLALTLQEVGAQALPIVSLISFLVGVILAFLGAIQLVQFGAQIYIANLVGIGMAREMGAMMVGIILAGRTGAAFAAQLGTMQVNEEIDALTTFGFSPMEFLVLPRMLALILMAPLLCLYADVMGILGGALVGITTLDLPTVTYFQQTQSGVRLADFAGGLIKSAVYGAVVAVAGCLRGLQCGRSSAAVGQATTSAVVTSIVFIILSMAVLTVIFNVIGL